MSHPVRLLVSAVLALALVGCAAPRPLVPGARLRVVSWNVHDLFDEFPPGRAVPDEAAVAGKIERVAAVLRSLEADLVALQEVENREVLGRLGRSVGEGLRGVLEEGTDPGGIDVAVLARLPIARAVAHGQGEDRTLFPRPPLEVELELGGRRVIAIVAHLKSKAPSSAARADPARRAEDATQNDRLRGRQAIRLRAIADAAARAHPDALVIVAGDLNDEPGSAPLAPLLADGEWTDVCGNLPLAATWTYRYRGRLERIDYVLVARRDAARARCAEAPPIAPAASDHRPVVLDLAVR